MLNRIKENVFCSLDIGNQYIKAGMFKVAENNTLEVQGLYHDKIYGYQQSSVTNLNEFAECIQQTLLNLEKKSGMKAKRIQVGIGGDLIEVKSTKTEIPLTDRGKKIVHLRDIERINRQARLLNTNIDEEVIHSLAQYYVVDANIAINPIGLYGRKLAVQSLLFIVNSSTIQNVQQAIHQAGYDVAHVFSSSILAAYALSDEDVMKKECVVMDMGAQTTNIMFFKGGILKSYRRIKWGGLSITSHIAQVLNLPLEMAEEIKKDYGTLIFSNQHQDEEILVKRENQYVPIKRKIIFEAISSSVAEFSQEIKQWLSEIVIDDKLKCPIIITGGGGLLAGMLEKLQSETGMNVSLAKNRIPTKLSAHNISLFSSVIGLAENGFNDKISLPYKVETDDRWPHKMVQRIREIYQEYF